MALQSSGPISISQINAEVTATDSTSLTTLSTSVGKSAPHAMSEFYGYSACPSYGTFYTSYCSGYSLYYRYHDGSCGFYDVFQYGNAAECGYSAPTCYYFYASYDGYFDYYDCNGTWTSEYFWYGRGVCAQSAISSALYNSGNSCLP